MMAAEMNYDAHRHDEALEFYARANKLRPAAAEPSPFISPAYQSAQRDASPRPALTSFPPAFVSAPRFKNRKHR